MRRLSAILVACLTLLATHVVFANTAGLIAVSDAIQPQVAVDDDGNFYVVSLRKGNIVVSASTDRGKSFQEPVVAIDAEGRASGGAQRGPRVGVDAQKRITISAWVPRRGRSSKKDEADDLFLVSSSDGGRTWSMPIQVNEVSGKAPENLHWMAVAPSGEVHLAWLDLRDRAGRGQDIYYAKVVDQTVGKNLKVATTVCECCAPGMTVDYEGNPIIAFREGGDKSSREIFLTRSSDQGKSFSKPLQVNHHPTLESTCPMSAPAVAISRDRSKIATAWKDIGNGKPTVYWAFSTGPQPAHESLVREAAHSEQNHPALGIDASGTVWIAWVDKHADRRAIYVRSSNGDEPQAISTPAEGIVKYPALACNAGTVAVVYEAQKDDQNVVMFRLLQARSN